MRCRYLFFLIDLKTSEAHMYSSLFLSFGALKKKSLYWSIVDLQQSDSVIHVSVVFQIIFSGRLLQYWVEFPVLYTVGPC